MLKARRLVAFKYSAGRFGEKWQRQALGVMCLLGVRVDTLATPSGWVACAVEDEAWVDQLPAGAVALLAGDIASGVGIGQ